MAKVLPNIIFSQTNTNVEEAEVTYRAACTNYGGGRRNDGDWIGMFLESGQLKRE